VDVLSRPYRTAADAFFVRTSDGVDLVGHRMGTAPVGLVFAHGFTGWHRKPRLVEFQEELARWFTVYAFDLRGHGGSGGISGFGAREHLDVDAVVRRARADGLGRVVTVGGSMGGIAVIRHAALLGGVDAVVAVSTPARWNGHHTDAVRKLAWLTATDRGRRLLRWWGTRTPVAWERIEDPVAVVDRIAPTPLIIVHGRDDHFFDEEEAWMMFRRAKEPKRLLLSGRFGHAEDGYGPAFARQIALLTGAGP
jgi:pimeloyl-ACP methyl ester carboxylesterase